MHRVGAGPIAIARMGGELGGRLIARRFVRNRPLAMMRFDGLASQGSNRSPRRFAADLGRQRTGSGPARSRQSQKGSSFASQRLQFRMSFDTPRRFLRALPRAG